MTEQVEFKPSDVVLRGVPLTATMGRCELEMAAAIMVRVCQVDGDAWRPVEPHRVGEVLRADVGSGHALGRTWTNPFLRPDAYNLVAKGFARWTGEPGKAVEFTSTGFEAMRRWVRSGEGKL